LNKVRDYRVLEREFITTDISIRELCRRHGISAHSSVAAQAKKLKWQEKREQYQAKESESFIEKHADRMAERQARIRDKALDAIDEAITKFREDMRATEKKHIDGEWIEVSVMRLMPKDLALSIDRLQILFDQPSLITEGRDLGVKSDLPLDALQQLVEMTRGAAPPDLAAAANPTTRRLSNSGVGGQGGHAQWTVRQWRQL
jgi:hypothetical protein